MGKGGPILSGGNPRDKPKSLIEAISDIQMYAAMEREGQPLPEEYLLLRERVGFAEVGLKGGLGSTLISGLMLPLSIAVIQHLFPIFGTFEPSWFDQTFALILGVSFQLGYNMVTALNLAACYLGAWCRKAIWALYGGLLLGKGLVVFFLFWFYHWLYFILTPALLHRWFTKSEFVLKLFLITPQGAQHLERWILAVRHVLLISAWMVLALTAVTSLIAIVILFRGARQTAAIQARRALYHEV